MFAPDKVSVPDPLLARVPVPLMGMSRLRLPVKFAAMDPALSMNAAVSVPACPPVPSRMALYSSTEMPLVTATVPPSTTVRLFVPPCPMPMVSLSAMVQLPVPPDTVTEEDPTNPRIWAWPLLSICELAIVRVEFPITPICV